MIKNPRKVSMMKQNINKNLKKLILISMKIFNDKYLNINFLFDQLIELI